MLHDAALLTVCCTDWA